MARQSRATLSAVRALEPSAWLAAAVGLEALASLSEAAAAPAASAAGSPRPGGRPKSGGPSGGRPRCWPLKKVKASGSLAARSVPPPSLSV